MRGLFQEFEEEGRWRHPQRDSAPRGVTCTRFWASRRGLCVGGSRVQLQPSGLCVGVGVRLAPRCPGDCLQHLQPGKAGPSVPAPCSPVSSAQGPSAPSLLAYLPTQEWGWGVMNLPL